MGKTAIIGFGCAGYHAAKALRESDPGAEIHVYTETMDAPYNPMLTTYYVAGKIDRETMMPYGSISGIAPELDLIVYNEKVKKVLGKDRTLILENGNKQAYDDIVISTGSHPLVPPISGLSTDMKDIYVMRTINDADTLLKRINEGVSSAVVIGASWVGIKVIEALYAHKVPSVLADMAPRIFPTATMPQAANIIHERLADMGIMLKFGSGISSITHENEQVVCTFADGTQTSSDIVALCLGLRPTVDIVDPNEFDIGKGLRVNSKMQTNMPHIYAAGDCCEAYEITTHQLMNINLWANSYAQGEIAGKNIAGVETEFQGNFIHNITHFLGMDFVGLGDNRTEGEYIFFQHPKEGWQFHAIVNNDGIGCINILDNHTVSGPAKATIIKHLTGSGDAVSPTSRLALLQCGLPEEIIEQIGGL